MDYKEDILSAARAYCQRTGRARGGIANAIMNDGKFFDRLEAGGGCTVDTYQKVMQWFQENMPAPPGAKTNGKHRRNEAP